MRVGLRGLADLTNVNAMLLPELGPNLPGPTEYVGGLGQATCYDELGNPTPCGNVPGSGGASSGSCFDAYGNSIPCTSSTVVGPIAPGSTITAPQSGYAAATTAPVAGGPQITPAISSTTLLWIGGGIFAVVLLMMAARR